MLQVLAHPNLPHELVLVTIHSSQLAYVSENVLKSVRELECVDVVQSVLNM